jgi:hypothetical protein
MDQFTTDIGLTLKGHVLIRQYETMKDLMAQRNYSVLLDKDNAVHRENASILIARGITDRPDGSIYSMYFGNGGAVIDPLGNVVLNPPNIIGAADLYNPTYFEAVDDRMGAPAGNQMAVRHVNGTLVSDADIYCTIGLNEPFGQQVSDNVGSLDLNTQEFAFSELGLKTQDDLLITHITFTPILKDAQRIMEVVYTLVITVD